MDTKTGVARIMDGTKVDGALQQQETTLTQQVKNLLQISEEIEQASFSIEKKLFGHPIQGKGENTSPESSVRAYLTDMHVTLTEVRDALMRVDKKIGSE